MQIAGYVEQTWNETEYIDKVNFLVRILGFKFNRYTKHKLQ